MSGVTPNADAQRRSLLDPFQACVGILDDAAGCGGAGRRPGMRRVLPKAILKKDPNFGDHFDRAKPHLLTQSLVSWTETESTDEV